MWLKTSCNPLFKPGVSTSIDACDGIYPVIIDYSYTMTKLMTVFKMWHPNTTLKGHMTVSRRKINNLFLVIHQYKILSYSHLYIVTQYFSLKWNLILHSSTA